MAALPPGLTDYRLNNGPLFYVLGVLDFEPLLKLGDYIPMIQENLRLVGFPLIQQAFTSEITFDGQSVTTNQLPQWAFTTPDHKSAIILTQSKIAVETVDYRGFQEFSATLKNALYALRHIPGLIIAQRLGLRYVNAIQPEADKGFDTVLHERLAGVDSFNGLDQLAINMAISGTSEHGRLTIQVRQAPHGVNAQSDTFMLPPDITPKGTPSIRVDPRRPSRLLDLDHSALIGEDLNPEGILQLATRLHTALDSAFLESITQDAFDSWIR